jgi:hypothetical protein
MQAMDVEELYGLPLERFVPERNALTRELRAAGKRDEAAEVASLRKPSVAARAVNQLARTHRCELHRLFAAGDTLSEVQSSVLAGQAGGRDLSEAHARERGAVSELVEAASGLLAAEGLTPSATVLERIGETLHAAALDDDARKPVDEGRLERELRHVGLGMGAGADVGAPARRAPTKRTTAKRAPTEKTEARERSEAREQAEAQERAEADERAEAAKRARALKQAQATEKDAGRLAARAAKDLGDAERAHTQAAEALEQAKEALTAARREAKAAEAAHRTSERALRRLGS